MDSNEMGDLLLMLLDDDLFWVGDADVQDVPAESDKS